MFTAYKKFWLQYADFTGKSTRSDYWWVVLCNFLIALPFGLITGVLFLSQLFSTLASYSDSYYTMSEEELVFLILSNLGALIPLMLIAAIWNIAIFVPTLALQVRRLRDAGFHWAFIFFNLGSLLTVIPIIGWLFSLGFQIALIVFFCFPSKESAGNNIAAGPATVTQAPLAAPDMTASSATGTSAVNQVQPEAAVSSPEPAVQPDPNANSAAQISGEDGTLDSAISETGE
ncbi:DUF805 domain-containing protein [Streptococcus chenjunshii]|uniref:DUF805 domain-containing protein n=1 Tax=Streptococcus chenjunshii TaxID=2173853 RepID=A0A372KKV3_9STRE|nr:DUF805 domain-containing protein [Streptococcus chenjunshii]AXQ78269.1 DUF805 domain-containing protein [Streptococcus chenjunshii]RFU50716.1 DUF805 domain-containing protein [Streptococcus chenjunshii]RFU52883.1 DUF805 domain-containing protein [Streptococcus chenjunshii]